MTTQVKEHGLKVWKEILRAKSRLVKDNIWLLMLRNIVKGMGEGPKSKIYTKEG